jgi:hypothetical protein
MSRPLTSPRPARTIRVSYDRRRIGWKQSIPHAEHGLFGEAHTVDRTFWVDNGWFVEDTLMSSGDGTGVSLTCPSGHRYWGRSLSGAKGALRNEDSKCEACMEGQAYVIQSS